MGSISNNNVILTIGTGDGISHAIDRQLDAELNVDVKLGASEWNSVFSIIKQDKAVAEKQYSGDDSDINNNKNYIVQEGTYQVTKNAWTQIVQIAKQKMGITGTTPAEEEVKAAEEETPPVEGQAEIQKSEEVVKSYLQAAGIQVSDTDLADIVDKYEAMVGYAKLQNQEVDEAVIEERVVNYAKALKYAAAEAQFAEDLANEVETSDAKYTNAEITEALETIDTDPAKFKEAYLDFGAQYVEQYDDAAGDGSISVEELVAMEAKELGHELTDEEKKQAVELAKQRIEFLDKNDNGKIDKSEAAAYLWAMSKILDAKGEGTSDDITSDEWFAAQKGITGNDENTQEWFKKIYDSGYEGLKEE